MKEKWVRVVIKNGDKILHDANYLVCKEEFDVLHNEVLFILATQRFTSVEFHEFWAPERKIVSHDSGNIFA